MIFVLEVTLVASVYAYKEQIDEGFEHGLTRAVVRYGLDTPRTNDLDKIQEKVRLGIALIFSIV